MKKLLFVLFTVALLSCKKEPAVVDDHVLITIHSPQLVKGDFRGALNQWYDATLCIIDYCKDTTIYTKTPHFETYALWLVSSVDFTADVAISGAKGVKEYHFESKNGNLTKRFTN